MKIAVIGAGYWGPNLVRNFLSSEGVDGVICCDLQEKRLEKITRKFPGVETTTSYEEILCRNDVDAVVLATPLSTHHPLGMQALRAGKHLLVEKPMAQKTADAIELMQCAEEQQLTLMVDHTFVYTSAVRKIKEYLDRGDIGDILYFDSVRVNLGLFQRDANVIWDLAPHDLSIMHYLIKAAPIGVSAMGVSHFNHYEDVAYITVVFPGKILAHFHVNWLSPVKVRRILVGGTKLMVVYDDMETSEKVKMYNKGVEMKETDPYKALVEYRVGDMFAPFVDQGEALSLMARDFINAVKTGSNPVADATAGLRVVKVLEAAETSLKLGGQFVELSGDDAKTGSKSPKLRLEWSKAIA